MKGLWRKLFLVCAGLLVAGNVLYSQKAPAKDGGLGRLFKDFDNWYVDTEGQLTLKLYMTGEGWTSRNTLTIPQDPGLYFNQAPFGSFDPWYYFTLEYQFKPLRFLKLIFFANIMPATKNRVYSYTASLFAESQAASAFINAYQDLQGEISVDIGPGDMTLSARYTHRIDTVENYLTRNGYSSFSRENSPSSVGWPNDPNYFNLDTTQHSLKQEYRQERLVMSLKNQKNLTIQPSITMTGDYLDIIRPAVTNLNYDWWTFNGYALTTGRVFPSYIAKKLRITVDGSITFRPTETLTFVLGGTITPSFVMPDAGDDDSPYDLPYPSIAYTKTAYLNTDIRLSPRILFQTGFKLTTWENTFITGDTTVRWTDLMETPGWISRYQAANRDIWSFQVFTGVQYK